MPADSLWLASVLPLSVSYSSLFNTFSYNRLLFVLYLHPPPASSLLLSLSPPSPLNPPSLLLHPCSFPFLLPPFSTLPLSSLTSPSLLPPSLLPPSLLPPSLLPSLLPFQQHLSSMIGTSSGYLEGLPKPVQRRIKALKNNQVEIVRVDAEFHREVCALQASFEKRYQEVYDKGRVGRKGRRVRREGRLRRSEAIPYSPPVQ